MWWNQGFALSVLRQRLNQVWEEYQMLRGGGLCDDVARRREASYLSPLSVHSSGGYLTAGAKAVDCRAVSGGVLSPTLRGLLLKDAAFCKELVGLCQEVAELAGGEGVGDE